MPQISSSHVHRLVWRQLVPVVLLLCLSSSLSAQKHSTIASSDRANAEASITARPVQSHSSPKQIGAWAARSWFDSATWKYEDTGTDLGTAWKEPGFDDSAWQTGPAPLGFGEDYITTTIADAPITSYFRYSFTNDLDPTTLAGLVLNSQVDDGFVAYLNGVEIAREQLPDGPIEFSTAGSSHEGGGFQYSDASAGLASLVVGENVLAVEVHNANTSDLVMDMVLLSRTCPGGPTSVADDRPDIPVTMSLHQNFPNPFNPETTIHIDIAANQPSNQNIRVEIYDLLGRKIRTLFDGTHSPGTLHLNWDATDDKGVAVATGVYIYRLRTGTTDVAKRMTLLR